MTAIEAAWKTVHFLQLHLDISKPNGNPIIQRHSDNDIIRPVTATTAADGARDLNDILDNNSVPHSYSYFVRQRWVLQMYMMLQV